MKTHSSFTCQESPSACARFAWYNNATMNTELRMAVPSTPEVFNTYNEGQISNLPDGFVMGAAQLKVAFPINRERLSLLRPLQIHT
jgi:hypothetical protein